MKVSLKEYAQIHGLSHGTVRSYVSRGQLPVLERTARHTYVDSDAVPTCSTRYVAKYGKQPELSNILRQMKSRCSNPKNPRYQFYGGKGVKVCDKWNKDTSAFIEWALKYGYRKGLTIDRIDSNGDYCPENCRWLTRSANSRKMAVESSARRAKKIAEERAACCIL